MNRRTLLRNGGTLTALVLAGCTGAGSPVGEGDETTAPPTSDIANRSRISDSRFAVIDRTAAATEPMAGVSFDQSEGLVRITGTIEGSDGCKTAALGAIDYRPDADELQVAVLTNDRPGTGEKACTQALVYISYEATVSFSGGLPSAASVSHDGTEITVTARDSATASEDS